MKNKLLFTFFIVSFFIVNSFSQEIQLYYNEVEISSGSSFTVTATDSKGWYNVEENHLLVKNATGSSMTLKMKIEALSTISENDSANYCFGQCYIPKKFNNLAKESPELTIGSVSTYTGFSGHFKPDNVAPQGGTIKYTFYDINNSDNKAEVLITYGETDYVSSINNLSSNKASFSLAYPNPARNYTTFTYDNVKQNSKSYLIVNSIIGEQIKKFRLPTSKKGKFRINLDGIKKGVYFYSIIVDNKIVKTNKLIIKD